MAGAFTILSFAPRADPEVIYVNYSSGSLFPEKPEEL